MVLPNLPYTIEAALRRMRRAPVLTCMAVFCLAVGCGSFITMATVLHVISGDPIPGASSELYYPRIDYETGWHEGNGPDPSNAVTLIDAEAMSRFSGQKGFAMAAGTRARVTPDSAADPFYQNGHGVTRDFFALFAVPFAFGSGWSVDDDANASHAIVLSKALNDRLFQGANSVGRVVNLNGVDLRVTGVMREWNPEPRFYADTSSRAFGHGDTYFIPFRTLLEPGQSTTNNVSCFGPKTTSPLTSESCTWVNYWTDLPDASALSAFMQQLVAYASGRTGPASGGGKVQVTVFPLMAWLERLHLVPRDVLVQTQLAFMFYIVCILCVIGLLLSKFISLSPEIAIRRAMGASQRIVFGELLSEALLVGLAGGVVGSLLSELGVFLIRRGPDDYAHLVTMDLSMLGLALGLALAGCALSAALPAFIACRIPPVKYLRSN